ncbi:DUF4177 domain-containing protein [Tabrizicola sp.]|jgi:hypothetical protein|uniref:DUF4177 domain-containing protein n=1 Tax=Tabrizicola sp. TaxID=2005166 RepID=UPI003D2E1286
MGQPSSRYEFKVIPAPRRGEKARGAKTTEERFALALTETLNAMAAEGWDYLRAETLPVDERSGLTGTKTSFQNMLVFRRSLEADAGHTGLTAEEPGLVATRRIGPADAGSTTGSAPPLGPAKPDVAAE